MKNRLFAILIMLSMVISLAPLTAFAEDVAAPVEKDANEAVAPEENKNEEPLQPKDETPAETPVVPIASAAPAVLAEPVAPIAPPGNLVLTTWEDLDPYMDQNTGVTVLTGVETLDMSGLMSGGAGGREFIIDGTTKIIGSSSPMAMLFITLKDGAELTLQNYFGARSSDSILKVEANSAAKLHIVGENILEYTIATGTNSSLAIDGGVLGKSTNQVSFSGNVSLENTTAYAKSIEGTLDLNNTKLFASATVQGNINAIDSDITAIGNTGYSAIIGNLSMDATSTANLRAGFTNSNTTAHPAAIDGNLSIATGAEFSAYSRADKAISGEISGDGTVLQGAFEADVTNRAYTAKVNDFETVYDMPADIHSFAIAVPQAAEYKIADIFGMNKITSTLSAGVNNTNLVWKKLGGTGKYFLDGSAINIFMNGDKTVIDYNSAESWPSSSGVITINQARANATSNFINIEAGVKGLKIVLDNLNIETSGAAKTPCITIGEDCDIELILVGESTLTAGSRSAAISIGTNSKVKISGDGVLNATMTDIDGVAIGALPGAMGGVLTIGENANVVATGYSTGAAIGGAFMAVPVEVIITDNAKVTAIGGSNGGAAIGGGQYADGTKITIGGHANVTAFGGAGAAAIGAGGQSNKFTKKSLAAGEISILDNARVTATAGAGAAAIGRGRFAEADLPDGAIVISETAQVTAFSDGACFAIDTKATGTSASIASSILNARFANGVMEYNENQPNKINIIGGGNNIALELGNIGSNNPIRAFATTIALQDGKATDVQVQNGAKTYEMAEYALLDGDAQYIFKTGTSMTTRDELKYKSFTIKATAGANGKIDPIGDAKVAPLSNNTFTVTPNTGYRLVKLTVDGTEAKLTDGKYIFSAVDADHEINATFEVIYTDDGDDDPVTPPEEIIPKPDVPLVPVDPEIPAPTDPEITEEIKEPETPLAPAEDPETTGKTLPKTGGVSALGFAIFGTALIAIGTNVRGKKSGGKYAK